jgi:hypothetical protein
LVDDTSRVARNQREALQIFEDLKFHGCHVYYVSQGIDSNSASASMMLGMNAIVDAEQIEKLSKSTHRGIEGRFQNGYSSGGRKYGYRSSPECSDRKDRYGNNEIIGYLLNIFEPEAKVVKEIFHFYGIDGFSPKEIAEILNKRYKETGKPKPPRGTHWAASTIIGNRKQGTGILNSEKYIGKLYWNRTQSKRDPKTSAKVAKRRMPNEWKYLEIPRLRIISDNLWFAVKERQDEIKTRSSRRYVEAKKIYSVHLLTGLAVCGECGGTFGIVSGGKYAKYGCIKNWNGGTTICSNNMKIDKTILEESLINIISAALLDEESIKKIYQELIKSMESYLSGISKQMDSKSMQDEIAKKEETIALFIGAISVTGITESLEKALREAEITKKELQDSLAIASTDGMINLEGSISVEDIREYFEMVVNRLVDSETVKSALESTITKLVVSPDIDGSVLLEAFENVNDISKFVIDLLANRGSRIRLQTGTRFVPYTSRTFSVRLHSSLAPNSDKSMTSLFIERGLYVKKENGR